jgi:Asp-tRNA(Asn)/Glu-tRNA(Gln) amidotransferase A subunit family amidase
MRALCVAALALWTALQPPPRFQLVDATIDDVRAALASRQITCRALVEQYIKRIEAYDKAGPALNAIQTINRHAVEDADRLDAALAASGPVGPLHCIPILVKDQIETHDMPTTYGSAAFRDFVPQRDATIVKKLRSAGAVIVGKTTMGEFASGYIGSAFGVVRNPYDPTRQPGGSSGGTGAGVAANFATVGIGEDTGGSVRSPAAFNSLVGLRPTLPLVSRFGMMPAKPTSDTIGPIGRSVRDVALVLDVIAGYDGNDPVTASSVGRVPDSYARGLSVGGLSGTRIAILRTPLDSRTDVAAPDYKEIRSTFDRAIADLKRLGADIIDPLVIADAGPRSERLYDDNVYETESAMNAYLAQHPNAPFKTLRDVLLSGKVVPSRARILMETLGHTTRDAGFLDLLLTRDRMRTDVLQAMADARVDAIAYATSDHGPTKILPDVMTRSVVADASAIGTNRRLAAVLAFPAITVPAGFSHDGLPIGLELMGREFSEPLLLKLAFAYEQGTHHRKPPTLTPRLGGTQ